MILDLPNVTPSALVDANFVSVCRRISTYKISALIDCELVWVWNVSLHPNGRNRELRFWLPSVVTPQMTARLTLNEVLSRLLPQSRQTLWAAEIGLMLLLGRDSVARLARQLEAPLVNRTWQFKRETVLAWLRERYIGGMP